MKYSIPHAQVVFTHFKNKWSFGNYSYLVHLIYANQNPINSALFIIIVFVWLSLLRDDMSMMYINHHFTLWYRLVKVLAVHNKEKNEQICYLGLLKLFILLFNFSLKAN